MPQRRGFGQGIGQGQNRGLGRMGGRRPGAGADGNCVCPNCGTKVPHQRGVPCYSLACPQCGAGMVRE